MSAPDRAGEDRREPWKFHTGGLEFELTTRSMRGPLIAERHPWRWFPWVLRTPALLLLLGLLLTPTLWTIGRAFGASRYVPGVVLFVVIVIVVMTFLVPFAVEDVSVPLARVAVLLAGVGVIGVWWAPAFIGSITMDGWAAYGRTMGWIGLALVLLGSGLWLAWVTRDIPWRWLWLPLVLPAGVSALVAGVAFRLIFQIDYASAIFQFFGWTGIQPYRIWFTAVLASAFVWTWLGFVVSLFRAGIHAILADPARHRYLMESEDKRTRLRRLLRLLSPLLLIVGITVGVAAARVFDVVLSAVPQSLQYDLDTVAVHWWRLSGDQPGAAAAYALPFALLVGVYAWLLQRGVHRHQHGTGIPARPRPHELEVSYGSTGRHGNAAAFVIPVLWLIPLGVLVGNAVYGPDGFGLESIHLMSANDELWESLGTTGLVAGTSTLIVLTVAAPVAYLLAALPSNSMRSRLVVVFLVAFAVVPVQLYLGVLHDISVPFSGTRVPLILVHAATGLPTAILILRGALLARPNSATADALFGLTSPETTVRRLLAGAGPALGAVAVLEFVQVWNDFVISLLISGAGASPLSLLLWGEARQLAYSADSLAAGAVVFSVPPMLLLLLCWHRWVVPGLTGGAMR